MQHAAKAQHSLHPSLFPMQLGQDPCSGWTLGGQHTHTHTLYLFSRYRDRRQINLISETVSLQTLLLMEKNSISKRWTARAPGCAGPLQRNPLSFGAGAREGARMRPFPQSGQLSGAITSRCEMTRGSCVPGVRTTQEQGAERPWQPCLGGGLN